MIEGVDGDDKYRMVEDEFIGIASQFTTHLHKAEYQRLKQQAKAQNADKIRSISRPAVGALTAAAKKRQEMRKHLAKQRNGLRRAAANSKQRQDDAGDDEDGFADVNRPGTSLYSLMERPGKAELPLTNLTSTTTSTRASAGFKRSSSGLGHASQASSTNPAHTVQGLTQGVAYVDEMETESNALDVPDMLAAKFRATILSRSRESPEEAYNFPKTAPRVTQKLRQELRIYKESESRPREQRERNTATAGIEQDEARSDNDEEDVFSRLRSRRQNNRPRREETKSDSPRKTERDGNGDMIPSFL